MFVVVEADSAWSGELRFDTPRHRDVLHLPWDWPRINSFPEWYTVEASREYRVRDLGARQPEHRRGDQLASGLAVRVRPGEQLRMVVTEALAQR